MRLGNEPIETLHIKGAKSSGITYTQEFEIWQAAVASGATLGELEKLYQGRYDKRFLAMVVTRYRLDVNVRQHMEAMKAELVRKEAKRRR